MQYDVSFPQNFHLNSNSWNPLPLMRDNRSNQGGLMYSVIFVYWKRFTSGYSHHRLQSLYTILLFRFFKVHTLPKLRCDVRDSTSISMCHSPVLLLPLGPRFPVEIAGRSFTPEVSTLVFFDLRLLLTSTIKV